MNKVTHIALVTAVIALAGCSSAPKKKDYEDAAYLTYKLPASAARIKMDLTLTRCKPIAEAKAVITVMPVVTPSPHHRFTLDGSQLASFTKKREVDISLYPNGTIKSVNATVADRTGAILVNAIKIIGSLAALDSTTRTLGACTGETDKQINRVAAIKGNIQRLRDRLGDKSGADPVATQKQIDAWASEMGRIQSEYLFISVAGEILFPEKKGDVGGIIAWKNSDFRKWFGKSGDETVTNFQLGWCVTAASAKAVTCNTSELNRYALVAQTSDTPAEIKCEQGENRCATTLVFREPAEAVLTLFAVGNDLVDMGKDVEVAQLNLPIAQWGDISYFDFSARFGESKAVSLSFDEYGRRTSFGWKSNARGEEVTAGLQGIADAATTFSTARAGQEVKEQKAEIDALETQQKLNKLRHCQATIEAGGFVCPDQ